MLDYLRDRLAVMRLSARYQRLVHERLIEYTHHASEMPDPDARSWRQIGPGTRFDHEPERIDARTRARTLATHNPYVANMLRLLDAYVTGPGLATKHQATAGETNSSAELLLQADRIWNDFLSRNRRHYSFREHARRTWRDGECFLRLFAQPTWPPVVRFIDPEAIGSTPDAPDSQGILTDRHDVETPVAYLRIDPTEGRLIEQIDADEVLHTRVGVDSNEKRGMTVLSPLLDVLEAYDRWAETELQARKLQSSIVLWRKVQGSPQQAYGVADAASDGTGPHPVGGVRRERLQPGTILTTNHGTEIEFLSPKTNFGDAVPLGRMLLLSVAAGAGLPEFMLTADASNANFASTMVAEGPAVKFFQREQQFFAEEFTSLWRMVMQRAIDAGRLPPDALDRLELHWSFPQLVNRDRPRERLADVRLVESGILSRAEVARRDGVDPDVMSSEIAGEQRGDRENRDTSSR